MNPGQPHPPLDRIHRWRSFYVSQVAPVCQVKLFRLSSCFDFSFDLSISFDLCFDSIQPFLMLRTESPVLAYFLRPPSSPTPPRGHFYRGLTSLFFVLPRSH